MATVRDFPERHVSEAEQASRDERLHAAQEHMTREQRRPRYGQPFFPGTFFGTGMYVLATVIALLILATTNPAPLQNPADPINHEHVNPRPEWYFLFLFQVLKIFGGPLELIGTVVIPGILGLLLLGLPFYDRNWSRRAVRRPIAVASASIIVFLVFYLTYIPLQPTGPAAGGGGYLTSVAAKPTFANIEAIFAKNCQPCHFTQASGGLHLDTYQNVMAGGNGGGVGAPPKVIKPGNAAASYLWQVVEWKQKVGGNMPLGAPQKIPAADRDNIRNWINNGAKNS